MNDSVIKPEDKDRLLNEAYKRGYYHQGHERCCSQSVMAAVMETLGFKDDAVFKAVTTLAGGGGLFGDSGCGAYNAGLLVIGLLKGRSLANYSEEERASARCFEIGRALHQRFIDEYGTIICRDIQTNLYGRPFWGVDPDEYTKVDAAGAHTTVGTVVVGKIARWVVEVIFEEGLLDELNALRKEKAYTAPSLPADA